MLKSIEEYSKTETNLELVPELVEQVKQVGAETIVELKTKI
jgi:hypothetical protein